MHKNGFRIKHAANLQNFVTKELGWGASQCEKDLIISTPEYRPILKLSNKFEISDSAGHEEIRKALLSTQQMTSMLPHVLKPSIQVPLSDSDSITKYFYHALGLMFLTSDGENSIKTIENVSNFFKNDPFKSSCILKFMTHISVDYHYVMSLIRFTNIMTRFTISMSKTAADDYEAAYQATTQELPDKKDKSRGVFPGYGDFLNYVDSFLKLSPLSHTISINHGTGQIHYYSDKSCINGYELCSNIYQAMFFSDDKNLLEELKRYLNNIAFIDREEVHEYLSVACKAINNFYNFVLIKGFLIDQQEQMDFIKLHKIMCSMHMLFNTFISQNFSNSYNYRIQTTFSFLDKFANVVLGLRSFDKNDANKENNIFKKLLDEKFINKTLDIFEENFTSVLYLKHKQLIEDVCNSIKKFCSELKEDPDLLREIRNFFDHGAFEASSKSRFEEIILESEWPVPHGIFLLPYLWLLSFCLEPQRVSSFLIDENANL